MTAAFDAQKAEHFAQTWLHGVNRAAVVLMASVGHRTGLFDALAPLPPSTSAEIAAAAGMSERYVREWLAAMVTGGVVEYDPAAKTYRLPPEHAAFLTRAAVPNNLAAGAQWLAVLASAEDAVVGAFRHGEGVPYSAYHRFHEVMAEESAQTVVAGLEAHILPLVPGLTAKLAAGIDVLDIGCGAGRAVRWLAKRFPKSRFAGYDLSAEAVALANTAADQEGLPNARFEVRDLAELNDEARYDLVTSYDVIHDQAKPQAVVRNVARAVRPGGVFLMQDIAAHAHLHDNLNHPLGPFLYTISCMHCMSVSLAGGGPGLGTCWGEETAVTMLREAGFADVAVSRLPHDIINNYYVARHG